MRVQKSYGLCTFESHVWKIGVLPVWVCTSCKLKAHDLGQPYGKHNETEGSLPVGALALTGWSLH